MAKAKLEVSLSPIAAQIDQVTKKLKALRPRVAKADQKKIDLEIKVLLKARKGLAALCHNMTSAFTPASEE